MACFFRDLSGVRAQVRMRMDVLAVVRILGHETCAEQEPPRARTRTVVSGVCWGGVGPCGEEVGEQASWEGPALVLPRCGQAGTLFSSRAVLRG